MRAVGFALFALLIGFFPASSMAQSRGQGPAYYHELLKAARALRPLLLQDGDTVCPHQSSDVQEDVCYIDFGRLMPAAAKIEATAKVLDYEAVQGFPNPGFHAYLQQRLRLEADYFLGRIKTLLKTYR